jgi:cytochrome P450 family 135
MSMPPVVSSPALWQTLRWSFRPLAFMAECRQRYGEAFGVNFLGFGKPMYLLSDPAAIRALYTERSHGLPPGRSLILEPILGPRSVLVIEGADHLARRKLMLPAFHGERMRAYEETVRAATVAEVDSWPLGEEFAIHPRMQAITLEVILRAVFGVSEGPRLDGLRARLADVLQETASPRSQLIGLATQRFSGRGPWARFEAQLREVDELMFAEIAEHRRRDDLAERSDILSMLMTAEFEDGTSMDDKELRDQLMTLLLAGHETTATALAWTFDLLLREQRVLTRLRRSLAAGEEDYLRATISESLRLRPVVPLAGRRLAEPLVAGDLELPVGTDVTPAIWLVHTREDLYPEPFAFRPERFLTGKPDSYAWVPFGGGVRRCLGATFAEFEMRIVLEEILGRCELRKASPEPEQTGRRNITLSPKAGTPVVLEHREPAREPELAAAL